MKIHAEIVYNVHLYLSSKLHTLHTEKTIQENVINCKRQEANDKILSKKGINVHYIQFQHEFS
jgi:hypothetical protein